MAALLLVFQWWEVMTSLPSERHQYTLSTGRLFSEAAITPAISRSITLNCSHYNRSELVMISYYNGIDPPEGSTPASGAEAVQRSVLCFTCKYDKEMLFFRSRCQSRLSYSHPYSGLQWRVELYRKNNQPLYAAKLALPAHTLPD